MKIRWFLSIEFVYPRNLILLTVCFLFGFSLQAQSLSPKPFFLQTRPGDPPDSIFRSRFIGKHAKYFQEWTSQEENQRYQNYHFRKVQYIAYKNQIHSIVVKMDYSDFNKGFLNLLTNAYGEATKPGLYQTICYWKTPDYFISYEDDIVGDLLEIRIVSLAVQKQFEAENPEATE